MSDLSKKTRISDATETVLCKTHQDGGVGDANLQLADSQNKALFETTTSNTGNLPENYGLVKTGLLFGARKDLNSYNNNGYQMFIDTQGKFASRAIQSGRSQWYVPMYPAEQSNYYSSSIDELDRSGQYRTHPDYTTGTFPEQNSGSNNDRRLTKFGILSVYVWDSENVYNIYTCTDGPHTGSLFLRAKSKGNWGDWIKLNVHSLENSFDHHGTPHRDLDASTVSKAGYYHTDEHTSNLPKGLSTEEKEGVLKVLLKDRKKYLTYTAIGGDRKGQSWAKIIDPSARVEPDWEGSVPANLEIHNKQTDAEIKPAEYESKLRTDRVTYELKFDGKLGGPKFPETGVTVILKSMMLFTEGFIKESDRVGYIIQEATSVATRKKYTREAKKLKNESTWEEWSPWTEIGGSSSPAPSPTTDTWMIRPEHSGAELTDLSYNTLRNKASGFYKVNNNVPDAPVHEWGTLLLSWQNNGNHSGSLIYMTINGKMYYRTIDNREFNTEWKDFVIKTNEELTKMIDDRITSKHTEIKDHILNELKEMMDKWHE